VYDEVETLSDRRKVICEFGDAEVFVIDLMTVSGVSDEVVEMQNDWPKESDVARVICHGVLLVHGPYHLVHRHRVLGVVGEIAVFCLLSVVASYIFWMFRRTAVILNYDVVLAQSLFLFLVLLGHHRGIHHGHVRVQVALIVRFDGKNQSCHSAPCLLGDVTQRRPWKAIHDIRTGIELQHRELLPVLAATRASSLRAILAERPLDYLEHSASSPIIPCRKMQSLCSGNP
jgi:hypothetical protein